jgi:hypothetical protein
LRTLECRKGEIGGRRRLIASREDSGTHERRQGHDEVSGRRQRHSGRTVKVRWAQIERIGGERISWGASRVADMKGELTEATSTTKSRQWWQNGHVDTADNSDVSLARTWWEVGAGLYKGVRLRVGEWVGVRAIRNGWGGVVAVSACIMGVESTACAESCVRTVGGIGLIGVATG